MFSFYVLRVNLSFKFLLNVMVQNQLFWISMFPYQRILGTSVFFFNLYQPFIFAVKP